MDKHCAESDSELTNTTRSFAGINFVFAGHSMPGNRIKNFVLNTSELFQHGLMFCNELPYKKF